MIKLKTLLTLAALSFATFSASASTLLSDQFDYPDGNLVGALGSPWTAHSGSTAVLVTDSQIEINRSKSEDVNAPLFGGPYSTNSATTLYTSFKVKFTELPSTNGTYFAHYRNSTNFAYPGRITATATNSAVGNFRLAIGNGTFRNASTGQWGSDLSTGTVYTVVTRLVLSSGQCTMWIDPTLESDTSVDATDTLTPDNIDQYAFRQSSGEGVMLIDDLKVGTTFVDVAGPNSAPTISSIADQNIGVDTSTGPLDFTVTDAETPAASLNVTAVSDNPTLIPNLPSNLLLGGAGTNRTVTVTPAAGQQGSGNITLTVDDGVVTNNTLFAVNVGYPSISAIANQITPENSVAGPVAFVVGDTETALGSLTVTATSTNTTLVPNGNIVIANLGGGDRTVTITPTASTVGSTEITLTVDDGTLTAESRFLLTVYPEIGVILSDDFSYLDGSLNVVSGGKWANHSGTLDQTQVTNSYVVLSGAQSEDVNAVLSEGSAFPPFEASGAYVLYSRFTVNFSGLPGTDNYFAHFKNLTFGYSARIHAGTTDAAPGCFRLGVRNISAPTAWVPRDLALGVTYVVISRYNTVTGDSTLWINPISESDDSVDGLTPTTSGDSIVQYAFRQSGGIGDLAVDDLVVGTSFSDVAIPVSTEPIVYTFDGANLVLSWSEPLMSLESATNVAGPYLHVPGASSPYTNAVSGDQMYFRLRY